MSKKEQLNKLLNRPEVKEIKKEVKMSNKDEATSSTNQRSTRRVVTEDTEEATRYASGPRINFRDIEEALEKYNENLDVDIWIEQIEQNALIFRWSELETLVYARRLLEGLPKRFVNIELKPKTWNELKKGLQNEYGTEKNSALIHKKMASSRMKPTESFTEFLYRMTEIAGSQIKTKALITYIVDGISDETPNKLFLYNSKTLQELKERIRDREEFQPRNEQESKMQGAQLQESVEEASKDE